MKKIIISLPKLILCAYYKFISSIFLKFKITRKFGYKYFDKYEDAIFTIFSPYPIGAPIFRPVPSARYRVRHGIGGENAFNLLIQKNQSRNTALFEKILSQCTDEEIKEYENLKNQ